jgi:CRP-like cAMP-binding protein
MVEGEAAERFLSAPFLADVEPALRRALLMVLVEDREPAGKVLLQNGQRNDHLSFLIGGSAAIERQRKEGGRIEILATLHAPSIFGTTTFFTPSPPTFSVRAATDVWLLTLYHAAHEQLRRGNPLAAEAFALASLRVLSERFDLLDRTFSDYMARHPDDPDKLTEWAGFRARLFQESSD